MVDIMNYFSKAYLQEKILESGFKKYFKNTSWMLGAKILSMCVSFLTTIYTARNLGPANFGELSYALSFIGLFGFVASLGIDTILYRDVIKHPEQKKEMFGTAFILKICAGAVAGSIAILIAFLFAKDDVSRTLIYILAGTFVLNAFQIIVFDFQSRADSKYPSIVGFLIALILNLLKVTAITMGKGVIYLACIVVLESLLYAIMYIYIYEKKTNDTIFSWKFDKEYAYKLIKDSLPLIALTAFSMIYSRIDQVFIKHMIDAKAVGLYDSAVRISEVWSFLPAIIVTALYPAIVNAKITSEKTYNKRLAGLAVFLFILAITIAIPITLLSSSIMKTIYGNDFIGGVTVLKIYVWANIGTFLGALTSQYLVTENYGKILSFMALVPMIVNIVLNIIWIPLYGIEGAAYATLISYSLAPLSILVFKEMRKKITEVYLSLR
jgi:O-antigen/teichoic acid export membrane protein